MNTKYQIEAIEKIIKICDKGGQVNAKWVKESLLPVLADIKY